MDVLPLYIIFITPFNIKHFIKLFCCQISPTISNPSFISIEQIWVKSLLGVSMSVTGNYLHLSNHLIVLLSVKYLFQTSLLEMIVKNSDFESFERHSFTHWKSNLPQ